MNLRRLIPVLMRLFPTLIFILFFCVYIFSACRTNSGYYDSDEIVIAGYLLSVAHPPGYPLQTILTKLFTFIPVGSIAMRANIMSGFFSALTLMMVYLVERKILGFSLGDENEESRIASFSHKHGIMRHDKLDLKSVSSLSRELVLVTGVMVLGFSSQFWLYSSVVEVFALNNFLVMLGIWLGLKWNWEKLRITPRRNGSLFKRNYELRIKKKEEKGKEKNKELFYFILTCILIGIGLSHVQTYVLILPGFILLFFMTIKIKRELRITNYELRKKNKKEIPYKAKAFNGMTRGFVWRRVVLGLVLVVGSFVLVNLSLFWLNGRQQNFSWYFPQNLKGLYQEVTRWVYTSYDLENGGTSSAYFSGFRWEKLKAIPMYFGFLNEHFSYIGLILGVVGIWFWWRNTKENYQLCPKETGCSLSKITNYEKEGENKILFWAFVTWFLFGGLLMGMYSGYQERRPGYLFYNTNVGMMQRQYLQGEVVWGIFVMMGIWGIVKWIGGKTLLVVGFCSVLAGWMIFSNYNIGVQRETTIAYDYAKEVLDSAEEDSVIICLYDFPCFSLIYLQEVEGYRPDVTVLPRNRFFKYYFYERNPEYYAYNYLDQKDYTSALVYWNVQNKTTYVTDLTPGNFNFGMYDGTFFVVPHGYLFKVIKEFPEEIYESSYNLTENFLAQKKDERNYWLNGIEDLFANIHYMQAKQYAILGDQEKAMENIFLAQKLNKDFVLSKNLVTEIVSIKKKDSYEVGGESIAASDFVSYAKQKEEEKQIRLALNNYLRATFVESANKEARVDLANFYLKYRMVREGFEEYRRLNIMYPEDGEIERVLEELRGKLGIK